jgi:hypothetical protein
VNVLPLRAIAFQFLFLLVAIAIEGMVLRQFLTVEEKPIDYKTSMQYSATVNLLSTFVGWIVFFAVQPFLPPQVRLQLINYVFFERITTESWLMPALVLTGLGIFLGTFLVELQGLEILEWLLDRKGVKKETEDSGRTGRFRGRRNQNVGFQFTQQISALLVGNALSFSAILLILFSRLVEQGQLKLPIG